MRFFFALVAFAPAGSVYAGRIMVQRDNSSSIATSATPTRTSESGGIVNTATSAGASILSEATSALPSAVSNPTSIGASFLSEATSVAPSIVGDVTSAAASAFNAATSAAPGVVGEVTSAVGSLPSDVTKLFGAGVRTQSRALSFLTVAVVAVVLL
ncbi:hypothetical protein K438DRAFT_1973425 [Mycena galopus ATCC 62051]|nr:hypothetical protein K438DRAFT_1973425 [Mycena galopus ATCC 62051]